MAVGRVGRLGLSEVSLGPLWEKFPQRERTGPWMMKWASLGHGDRGGEGIQNPTPADWRQRTSRFRWPELLTFQKNQEILVFMQHLQFLTVRK